MLGGRALFFSGGSAPFSLHSAGAACHFFDGFYPLTGEFYLFFSCGRGGGDVVRARALFFFFLFFAGEHTTAIFFVQTVWFVNV